jgi:hypothetical protein
MAFTFDIAPALARIQERKAAPDWSALARRWSRVGSRVTCSPPVMSTDEDFVVLTKERIDAPLVAFGFCPAPGAEFYTGNDNGGFRSFRRGDVNLIVTQEVEFYDKFQLATHLATRFNLLRKEDRIALFQAILYDVGVDNLEDAAIDVPNAEQPGDAALMHKYYDALQVTDGEIRQRLTALEAHHDRRAPLIEAYRAHLRAKARLAALPKLGARFRNGSGMTTSTQGAADIEGGA